MELRGKLGEREKLSEISLSSLLNFPSTKVEKERESVVSLCKGGKTKEKVGAFFYLWCAAVFNAGAFDKAFIQH